MTRLQRVTFLALHNYLGLSQELLDAVCCMVNIFSVSLVELLVNSTDIAIGLNNRSILTCVLLKLDHYLKITCNAIC